MYLIFPPEYSGLADAVSTQAQQQYAYTKDTLSISTYDMTEDKKSKDVSEFRWGILKAMSEGAVFVNFKGIDEAHFFNTTEDLSIEDQINEILVAGKYAENRANYYKSVSPKTNYVGPTYVSPLAVVNTAYDSKQESFSVDYDPKMRNVLGSLQEDLWMKIGFVTSRMSSSLGKFLDEFPETAIVTFDKRATKKVESYQHVQMTAPRKIDREFGISFRNTVKRKDVEGEG